MSESIKYNRVHLDKNLNFWSHVTAECSLGLTFSDKNNIQIHFTQGVRTALVFELIVVHLSYAYGYKQWQLSLCLTKHGWTVPHSASMADTIIYRRVQYEVLVTVYVESMLQRPTRKRNTWSPGWWASQALDFGPRLWNQLPIERCLSPVCFLLACA